MIFLLILRPGLEEQCNFSTDSNPRKSCPTTLRAWHKYPCILMIVLSMMTMIIDAWEPWPRSVNIPVIQTRGIVESNWSEPSSSWPGPMHR